MIRELELAASIQVLFEASSIPQDPVTPSNGEKINVHDIFNEVT